MAANDGRTVGQVVDEAIAEPLAALAALEAAASGLATGVETAAEEYAAALETAETLEAWDAQRRVAQRLHREQLNPVATAVGLDRVEHRRYATEAPLHSFRSGWSRVACRRPGPVHRIVSQRL